MQRALHNVLLALAVGLAATTTGCAKKSPCPPANFTTLRNFVPSAFIAAPWFAQAQTPLNASTPREYCTVSDYVPINGSLANGFRIVMYSNIDHVNGPYYGTKPEDIASGKVLTIFPPTPDGRAGNGKFIIGPEILTRIIPGGQWRQFFGPYWIVAVGPSTNKTLKYEWAIASSGAPKYVSPNGGCTTNKPANTTVNPTLGRRLLQEPPTPPPLFWDFGGLWFLTRKPLDPVSTAEMYKVAKGLGFDTTELVPIPHEGCTYNVTATR